jgi:aquaglyceroporin related protein, other eukaryote
MAPTVPWKKLIPYAIAQILGCFCGAAVIYGNYKSAIDEYEGGAGIRTVPGYSETATAGVFNTYPQPFLSKTGQVFSEIIASTILIFVIFALKDDGNLGAGDKTPLMLFFLIFGIGATLGWETGYAINLARDFGPRLFTYCVGYGPNVWKAGDYYFWVRDFPYALAAFESDHELTLNRFRWSAHSSAPPSADFCTTC